MPLWLRLLPALLPSNLNIFINKINYLYKIMPLLPVMPGKSDMAMVVT